MNLKRYVPRDAALIPVLAVPMGLVAVEGGTADRVVIAAAVAVVGGIAAAAPALRGVRRSRAAARRDGVDVRWTAAPTGCCECGTGGPHHRGGPALTRYLYGQAVMADPGPDGGLGWAACSRHALAGQAPAVDYGTDRAVTLARAENDYATAVTA